MIFTELIRPWRLTWGCLKWGKTAKLMARSLTGKWEHARQLLTAAGYANGFDAGECPVNQVLTGVGEAVVNDLRAVGIRTILRSLEAAAYQAAHRDKT